jgi:hypothetical protein
MLGVVMQNAKWQSARCRRVDLQWRFIAGVGDKASQAVFSLRSVQRL